jgi:serine phosphatase RsbU (regulator of sigma subunit)
MIYYETPHHIFVTFFLGIADRKTNSIVYSSAGHLRPVVYRYGKSDIEVIDAGGLPLGMDDNDFFSETITVASLTLKPGDVFFQYTDGLTEAMNREREQFGEERLYDLIRTNGRKKVDVFTNIIARAVSEFSGLDQGGSESVKPGDDMAMIAIKRMK